MSDVTRKDRPTKREAILQAMLDVVVERGFHQASMSLVAERARASAGVIYHHFSSKEEIIQALYERLSLLEIESLLEGFSVEMPPRKAFVQCWNNFYRFCRQHGREMRFLEQCKSAGFAKGVPEHVSQEALVDFQQRFSSRSQGGVLREWPQKVIEALTLGVLSRLAQQPEELSPAVLQEIAETVWEAVRAPDEMLDDI